MREKEASRKFPRAGLHGIQRHPWPRDTAIWSKINNIILTTGGKYFSIYLLDHNILYNYNN